LARPGLVASGNDVHAPRPSQSLRHLGPPRPHEIAPPRLRLGLPELQIERPLEHIDGLVLLRADVQRHEAPGQIEQLARAALRKYRCPKRFQVTRS
jgi:hypothetical protein